MTRLFTFGCSFTQYFWPTWADLLGQTYDKHHNYGRAGAGNQYIFQQISDTIAGKKITEKDHVYVMWSTVVRYDYYKDNKWIVSGNIYNSIDYNNDGIGHSQDFVDRYVDPVGFYIRDCAFIQATKHLLDTVGCKYEFMSMMPLDYPVEIQNPTWLSKFFTKDIAKKYTQIYQECLSIIHPSVYEVIFHSNWNSRVEELEYLPNCNDETRSGYENHAGPDWPSWDTLQNGTAAEPSKEILLDMCQRLGAASWNDIIEGKLYRCNKDYHPTTKMHEEYLDAVLPNWRTRN